MSNLNNGENFAHPQLAVAGYVEPRDNLSSKYFWQGVLLGAGLTLVLTNEDIQKVLARGFSVIYTSARGTLEEIKEKIEDYQYEMKIKKEQ